MYPFITLAVGVAGDHWTKDPRGLLHSPEIRSSWSEK